MSFFLNRAYGWGLSLGYPLVCWVVQLICSFWLPDIYAYCQAEFVGVVGDDTAGPSLGRASLREDLITLLSAKWLYPATHHTRNMWWRSFVFGKRGVYVSVDLQSLTASDDYCLVARGKHELTFYGRGVLLGQSMRIPIARRLDASASVGVAGFVRHMQVDYLPAIYEFGGVVSYAVYNPGPLHFCTSSCPRHGGRLFAPVLPLQVHGGVRVIVGPDVSEFAWDYGVSHVVVPTSRLLGTITRYSNASVAGRFHVLQTGLANPDAFPVAMQAVTSGFSMGNLVRPNPDLCLIAAMSTVDDFSARPLGLVNVHNTLVSGSTVNTLNGPHALRDSLEQRVFSTASTYSVTPDDCKAIAAFAKFFANGAKLSPVSYEALEKTMKPSQIAEFLDLGPISDSTASRFSVFIKQEPVAAGRAARIIVPAAGMTNFRLGCYTRAIYEHATQFHCWGPGRDCSTTEQMVNHLHRLARSDNVEVDETDFSSYDSTIGALGVAVELAVMLECFGPEHKEVIEEELSKAYGGKVSANFGADADGNVTLTVTLGIGTYSGRVNTTTRNTKFHMYVEFRKAVFIGMSFLDAWKHVLRCLFSGDDGLVRYLGKEAYGALDGTGLIVKSRVYSTGHTHFLGRLYPDPWISVVNVASAVRVLSKLHLVTVPQGKTVLMAMAQRAAGCLVNDPHTPLLSTYWRAVLKAQPVLALDPTFFHAYDFERLTSRGAYTSVGIDDSVVYGIYASTLGVSIEALDQLDDAFRRYPALPYTTYPALQPLVIKDRAGLVFDGMPLGSVPMSLMDVRRTEEAIRAERKRAIDAADLAKSALSAATKSALPATTPVPPVPPQLDPPTCGRCLSNGHLTDECQDGGHCEKCLDFYHKTSDCTLTRRAAARSREAFAAEQSRAAGTGLAGPPTDVAVDPDVVEFFAPTPLSYYSIGRGHPKKRSKYRKPKAASE